MKKTLKGYILGILSSMLLFGIVAYAASTTTLYNVRANGVKIVIDGRELHPTDVNGNKVEPIIYNGTTYLPVRAVANAFNKAVQWDGPNYTVYLGDMDGKLKYPTVELENMTSINEEMYKTKKLTDNYGNRYSRAIYNISPSYTDFEFLLNMKYSKFKGVLYVPEGTTSSKTGYLQIIADGNTIYTSPEMTRASSPVYIDVDVTGYNDVKIEFSNSGNNIVGMCLGDAGFYQ
ncbi:MAG: NPCBM/NEW2 domain-containing protein [Oscillospiraceae bacterium]|nr:NPCBM/NEW2 domain-containing protein [Oscillospiraceae bacterium]